MKPAIPVFRLFDESMAREFYVDFLGFTVDWEHRFEPGMPLYMQISRGTCLLHLTGHFGDASPGSSVRIETPDLEAYCLHLRSQSYKHSRPGRPHAMPWGTLEISITDPSGNKLIFYETNPEK